jgi:hypothetical protein
MTLQISLVALLLKCLELDYTIRYYRILACCSVQEAYYLPVNAHSVYETFQAFVTHSSVEI